MAKCPKETRVLIMDDQETMLTALYKVVEEIGFNHHKQAENGKKGLELLKQAHEKGEAFGLVLLDWEMPGMTGLDVLKAIRAESRLKDLVVIMATAMGKPKYVMTAIKEGASNYIEKPIRADLLESKIDAAWEKLKK